MSRHPLPSGAWVELCEPADITERQRRTVRLALAKLSPQTRQALETDPPPTVDPNDPGSLAALHEYQAGLAERMGTEAIAAMFDVNDLVAAAVVVAASFLADGDRCTVDHVQNLRGRDYDALLELAAPFLPSFMGVDFDTRGGGDRSTPT